MIIYLRKRFSRSVVVCTLVVLGVTSPSIAAVPDGYLVTDTAPVRGRAGAGISGRDTWRLNNHRDYVYTLEQVCYCALPKKVQVYVIGDRVVQVEDLGVGRVYTSQDMLRSFRTINGYFSLIDELVARHPDSITIRHNRNLGYPEVIRVDPSYRMADEEVDYHIQDLKFLRKR
jgi:hypothetical protein